MYNKIHIKRLNIGNIFIIYRKIPNFIILKQNSEIHNQGDLQMIKYIHIVNVTYFQKVSVESASRGINTSPSILRLPSAPAKAIGLPTHTCYILNRSHES